MRRRRPTPTIAAAPIRARWSTLVPLVALIAILSACGDDAESDAEPDGTRSPGTAAGAEVVVDELDGPTQFVFDGDELIVAQLNGGENDGTGQVVEIAEDGSRRILYDNLDKPTGVLVNGTELWVMERTRLSRGPRDGGTLTVVVDGLPNNGRSQGTLTLTPDGLVLFNTSGAHRSGVVVERSGRLWTADEEGDVIEYASGFKHAYAHVFDGSGALWTTEVSDGRFDGQPPADEVVEVQQDVDHGWPGCVGDNRPVAEFGVTDCQDVPGSRAVFDPGATPTGIVVSPFDEEELLVALWVTGQVVSVPFDQAVSSRVVYEDLSSPQHLVARDGRLYVSEFGRNRIIVFD
ncbi:MAG: glucose sorbosone dehydrogenase [Actinomycetota bacterium]